MSEFNSTKSIYDNAVRSFDLDVILDAYTELSSVRDRIASTEARLEKRYRSSMQLMAARKKIPFYAKLICFLYLCSFVVFWDLFYGTRMTIEPGLLKAMVACVLGAVVTIVGTSIIYFLSLPVRLPKLRYWFHVPCMLITWVGVGLMLGTVLIAIRDTTITNQQELVLFVVVDMILANLSRSAFLAVEKGFDMRDHCKKRVAELETLIDNLIERYKSLDTVRPYFKSESWQD